MPTGDAFLAMELVLPGTSLTEMSLEPGLCTAAKEALARVHALGVVHGDVRLENMLVSQPKTPPRSGSAPSCVVLLDFGHARCGASTEDIAAEMAYLQQLLQE